MNSSISKRAFNRQRWLEHITDWKQSGHSQKVFCEHHHLGLASFQRWRRIFMTEEKTKDSSPVTFLPVSVMDPSASSLTLRVNDNLRLEISAGFDPNTLKQVIQVS
ncbi:MAG: IS66 family insertion sequence element accessory protein TnpB [Candidatus Thiodiazotropha sp. (ex Rostrolucina anterorostrata)]|nr:IS66 family insertion sequence element accessory protein TnpB [Candidatus Thiodiazotropha sp. (ex Rostrolucina anterorostrata)]